MAKKHKIALDYNNQSNFIEVDPQPFSLGVQFPEYPVFANGHQGTRGNKFVEWYWSSMSLEQFQELMAYLGLLLIENQYVEVTIFTRADALFFRKFNGILQRPNPGTDYKVITGGLIKDLTITISDLEQI